MWLAIKVIFSRHRTVTSRAGYESAWTLDFNMSMEVLDAVKSNVTRFTVFEHVAFMLFVVHQLIPSKTCLGCNYRIMLRNSCHRSFSSIMLRFWILFFFFKIFYLKYWYLFVFISYSFKPLVFYSLIFKVDVLVIIRANIWEVKLGTNFTCWSKWYFDVFFVDTRMYRVEFQLEVGKGWLREWIR